MPTTWRGWSWRSSPAARPSVGEAFNAVSPQAINLRGYAEAMYRWFGHEPRLSYLPFEQWKSEQDPTKPTPPGST
jgi:hypothetical protein